MQLPRKRSSEPRSEVVGVRLSLRELAVLDDLVEAGLFASRSEIAHWLITEGLRTIPVEKLSSQVRKIKKVKEEAKRITKNHWERMRKSYDEAFGEGYVHPPPEKGKIGYGTGIVEDDGGPIGLDWDRNEVVTDKGGIRIRLEEGQYTDHERSVLKRALIRLERHQSHWDKVMKGTTPSKRMIERLHDVFDSED